MSLSCSVRTQIHEACLFYHFHVLGVPLGVSVGSEGVGAIGSDTQMCIDHACSFCTALPSDLMLCSLCVLLGSSPGSKLTQSKAPLALYHSGVPLIEHLLLSWVCCKYLADIFWW